MNFRVCQINRCLVGAFERRTFEQIAFYAVRLAAFNLVMNSPSKMRRVRVVDYDTDNQDVKIDNRLTDFIITLK